MKTFPKEGDCVTFDNGRKMGAVIGTSEGVCDVHGVPIPPNVTVRTCDGQNYIGPLSGIEPGDPLALFTPAQEGRIRELVKLERLEWLADSQANENVLNNLAAGLRCEPAHVTAKMHGLLAELERLTALNGKENP